jgi:hypothetical protein
MADSTARRTVLGALAALLPGCSAPAGPINSPTLTPAAVPSATARTATPEPRCPELPSTAEVYICSSEGSAANALRLVAAPPTAGLADRLGFTLANRTGFTFRTGPDWWTLAAREGATWHTVAQGAARGRLAIAPGERGRWRLRAGSATTGGDAIAVTPGPHAFVVTGYAAGGELTAVIAPFVITGDRATDRGLTVAVKLADTPVANSSTPPRTEADSL